MQVHRIRPRPVELETGVKSIICSLTNPPGDSGAAHVLRITAVDYKE